MFQTAMHEGKEAGPGQGMPRWSAAQKAKEYIEDNAGHVQVRQVHEVPQTVKDTDLQNLTADELGSGVKDMQVEHEDGDTSKSRDNYGGKEMVSFGTNMTPDDESSDGSLVVKTELELATAVECFHARKYGAKTKKRGALKVNCSGSVKKPKNSSQDKYAGGVEIAG
jgi:hypothetical protein